MTHDITGLMAALPGLDWITDPALVRQKSRDFFWYSPVLKRQLNGARADAVAVPRNEEEVVRLLAECHARRIPVTTRGAGTGNYGQAMPLLGGVVLDMSAMDAVLWAKPGLVRAQAGAKIMDMDRHTRAAVGGELRFHPSTKRTATIGGFIGGGSSGIGSCTWGILREPGNVLGLRVVTMEETPRVLELRGADLDLANHAYGTTGIITEVEIPLAPAEDWLDLTLAFPSLMDAARFGDALTAMDGVVKKLVCVLAAPIAQQYFKGFPAVGDTEAVVLAMVAPPYLDAVAPLLARHRGREVARLRTEDAPVPAYEFTWNHTTLQALKVDRSITYLQTLFPAPDHLELIARMEREFGDEVPIHLEYVRLGGKVCCFGLQLVRFTTEERLNEIIRIHEDAGAPIFNPHAFTLEEGGMKQVDAAQLAFKRQADPLGLLNPGKMLAWDDPDWTPDRPGKVYLFPASDDEAE
ncbi:FAD-binding oxidoreductase [Roseococcus thiosulfatophilus]|uniref:FAD-binding oxidoreductase n=1 Tax=Roseococcus thiosulfatophilus TaxID=35813 RepID=UPI001A903FDA|nr:FAD-binding oxidoreductase [Roseococcus thiosulfatophilus]